MGHGHTDFEAQHMASSFGRFLKAAAASAKYSPNTKPVRFGRVESHVALYNPRVHADIITAAYESFKMSAVYNDYLEPRAEERRWAAKTMMEIADIAKTIRGRTKPRG